mmetsp:Transcript_135598/g.433793  ORF Transcript_135598/g.433793 Transcript_135598/m.433793 type:complete len:257 (-) Transcript_135598:381-1151(-)
MRMVHLRKKFHLSHELFVGQPLGCTVHSFAHPPLVRRLVRDEHHLPICSTPQRLPHHVLVLKDTGLLANKEGPVHLAPNRHVAVAHSAENARPGTDKVVLGHGPQGLALHAFDSIRAKAPSLQPSSHQLRVVALQADFLMHAIQNLCEVVLRHRKPLFIFRAKLLYSFHRRGASSRVACQHSCQSTNDLPLSLRANIWRGDRNGERPHQLRVAPVASNQTQVVLSAMSTHQVRQMVLHELEWIRRHVLGNTHYDVR